MKVSDLMKTFDNLHYISVCDGLEIIGNSTVTDFAVSKENELKIEDVKEEDLDKDVLSWEIGVDVDTKTATIYMTTK